jgi:hypothetical protein
MGLTEHNGRFDINAGNTRLRLNLFLIYVSDLTVYRREELL